jgi:hypothetical protein
MTIQTFNDATYGLSVYLNTGGIGDAIAAKADAFRTRADAITALPSIDTGTYFSINGIL